MDGKNQAASAGASPAANSAAYQQPKRCIGVRKTLGVCALVIATALSACSSSTSTPASTVIPAVPIAPQQGATSTTAPTLPPTPTLPPADTSTPQQTATPTPLDPCVLIPSQEASTFTGASFGAGLEDTTSSGLRICTYGANTKNVFKVDVIQAPDLATAKAAKAQFLADLEANVAQLASKGLIVTELPNFADGATLGTLSLNVSGVSLNGSAIGVLKGTIFFGFSDEVQGGPAPTSEAVQAEATTVLGRLP